VATLGDICRLKQIEKDGVEGVIVGRAIYTRKFTLSEAMEVSCKPLSVE
jgi:phosphoribosylformimino-5-aminoimidazole carboxamide ribonucleotide (ProFAR) isomerase